MREDPITSRDIYKTLWKCREFELTTLWQRSALLGVFLAVTYTGYGYLVMSVFEHSCTGRWTPFNLLGVGLCCFGMVFSALWCMMLKGSKMWYENYEAALMAFQECQPDSAFANDSVRADAAFGAVYSPEAEKKLKLFDFNDSLLSTAGGHYSVSRVAISIGVVSLVGWCALSVLHVLSLVVGAQMALEMVEIYGIPIALALFLSISVVVFVMLTKMAKSSSL